MLRGRTIVTVAAAVSFVVLAAGADAARVTARVEGLDDDLKDAVEDTLDIRRWSKRDVSAAQARRLFERRQIRFHGGSRNAQQRANDGQTIVDWPHRRNASQPANSSPSKDSEQNRLDLVVERVAGGKVPCPLLMRNLNQSVVASGSGGRFDPVHCVVAQFLAVQLLP